MFYEKIVDIVGKEFLIDYELSRVDNRGYYYFSYKILKTLITFRCSHNIKKHDKVLVQSITELKNELIFDIVLLNEQDSYVDEILSVFAYKVPLESGFKMQIAKNRNVNMVYLINDDDCVNSKLAFIFTIKKGDYGLIEIPTDENHSIKISLLNE